MTKNHKEVARGLKEVEDARAFISWMVQAKPGDVCVYHYGNLMRDRCYNQRGDVTKDCRGPLSTLADSAMKAAEEGRVRLYQRRMAEYVCEYLAVKR